MAGHLVFDGYGISQLDMRNKSRGSDLEMCGRIAALVFLNISADWEMALEKDNEEHER